MDLYLECAYTNFVNYIAECGNDHNAKEILIDGSFNYFIQKFFYIYALCRFSPCITRYCSVHFV
ncbi:unnamed protein product [Onchocerca flexuosa]|uniref:ANK_REP_REGION domain-containing protein n=1 Tax=Onchocerca flexuosa TaxID=387005 RepID=A0A183HJG5_9BILA|nr:unnamed protein product [Onchocerca flexuosa]